MHSEQGNVKIFAGKTGQSFAKKMCNYLGTELGNSEVIHFSDGNIFVRIKETVRNSDVYLVQPIGMDPNNELVEILFWIDAFKRASASSITVIVPYFGYAKGDKKDEPRVSIRARVCADCIEVVGADRFITMDLHAPQIQGFFRIPSDHLYSLPLLCESVKKYVDVKNLVVVSPDAGFAKTARKYADYLGTPVAIGDKTRVAHDEKAKILELIGDVTDKDCLIVDDFSISGGTLIDIAKVLKTKGAKRIFACLGHNILRNRRQAHRGKPDRDGHQHGHGGKPLYGGQPQDGHGIGCAAVCGGGSAYPQPRFGQPLVCQSPGKGSGRKR
ncbi:MAG: ribose-phosphate diphosphokinase [Christensenellaceae bacterium]